MPAPLGGENLLKDLNWDKLIKASQEAQKLIFSTNNPQPPIPQSIFYITN